MSVRVRIPTPLRQLTNGERLVEVGGADLAQAIDELDRRFPGLRARIVDEQGEVLRFVNIFVNGENIREKAFEDTSLKDSDLVHILPSVAGG